MSDETGRSGPTGRTLWIAVVVAAVVVLVAAGVAAALRGDDPPPHASDLSPATGASGAATDGERHRADALVARVTAGLDRFAELPAAVAAGYVPATDPHGYVVHYANWDVVRRGVVLDATAPSSLVYANTVDGPVLLGAMFMGPAPCRPGPDVGGPLTVWHAHDDLCLSAAHEVVGRSDGSGSCATGRHNVSAFFMLHVWTAPSLAASHQFETHLPRPVVASVIRTGRG